MTECMGVSVVCIVIDGGRFCELLLVVVASFVVSGLLDERTVVLMD